jgi:hypothetical protein
MTTKTKTRTNKARTSKRFISAVHTITYVPAADGKSLTATIDGIEVYTGTNWAHAFEAINTVIRTAGQMGMDQDDLQPGCNPFPYVKQAFAKIGEANDDTQDPLTALLGDLQDDDDLELAS